MENSLKEIQRENCEITTSKIYENSITGKIHEEDKLTEKNEYIQNIVHFIDQFLEDGKNEIANSSLILTLHCVCLVNPGYPSIKYKKNSGNLVFIVIKNKKLN